MRINPLFLVVQLLISLFLLSCSSSKWTTDNRQFKGEKVAIGLSPGLELVNRTPAVADSVVMQFQMGVLDSMMQNSLSRYIRGMSRGGLIDAVYSAEFDDADIVLVIEELTISRGFSIDFVLRGPVLKSKMLVAAYRGSGRIFETEVSGSQNMAYVARNGRRFYWMQDEDKSNPIYQQMALTDAMRSALGTAYRRFFEQ